jgi:hypothetical protein
MEIKHFSVRQLAQDSCNDKIPTMAERLSRAFFEMERQKAEVAPEIIGAFEGFNSGIALTSDIVGYYFSRSDSRRTSFSKIGGALQGGVNVFGAPKQLALQEKGLGLQAWQANNAASNQSWANILALISARNAMQPPMPQYAGYY